MLTLVEDSAEIARYEERLVQRIRERSVPVENIRVGFFGGNVAGTAYWCDEEGFWFVSGMEGETERRHWNCLGREKPKPGANLTIDCQISMPVSGVNRRIAGAFAKDESGNVFLVHRGKIGGGRRGIGLNLVREHFQGRWDELYESSNRAALRVIVVSQLESDTLLADISAFTREIARIKNLVDEDLPESATSLDSESGERSWWWVNQNKTWKQEREGSYIWAPQRMKNGSSAFHHVNVAKVVGGDVIFHYSNQRLVSVSVAQSDAYSHPKPPELQSDEWETDGYKVDVQYFDLLQPIHRDQIPIELRMDLGATGKSPFTRGGSVNQGYLFALTEGFVSRMVRLFPALLPDGVYPPEEDVEEFPDTTNTFEELRLLLRGLNVNKDGSSVRKYKPAVILSALEAIDAGQRKNEIRFDDLVPRFTATLDRYGIKAGGSQAEEAFFRLDKDGVWEFKSKNGPIPSGAEPSLLKRFVEYAYFPDRFWPVLVDDSYRSLLTQDILEHWFSVDPSVAIEDEPFDRADAIQKLITDIKATGFYFEPWQIATFVTALRTKPFVILAGVSGSGKSQLPQLVANITQTENRLIPVRPDWTDSSDVLGYVQLHGRLHPGHLLEFAHEAMQAPRQMHFCIIDEMNIARVERVRPVLPVVVPAVAM